MEDGISVFTWIEYTSGPNPLWTSLTSALSSISRLQPYHNTSLLPRPSRLKCLSLTVIFEDCFNTDIAVGNDSHSSTIKVFPIGGWITKKSSFVIWRMIKCIKTMATRAVKVPNSVQGAETSWSWTLGAELPKNAQNFFLDVVDVVRLFLKLLGYFCS